MLTLAMIDKAIEDAKGCKCLTSLEKWFADYRYIQERAPHLTHDEILEEMDAN